MKFKQRKKVTIYHSFFYSIQCIFKRDANIASNRSEVPCKPKCKTADVAKFQTEHIKFQASKVSRVKVTLLRLTTMSPLYPFGEPCSTGTHNETVKKLTIFCLYQGYYVGITASSLESRGNVISFLI